MLDGEDECMMHDKSRKLNIKSRYSKGVSTCTVFRIDKLANSCDVMSAMDTSHALDSTHVIQRYYSHSLSNQTKNGCNCQCQPHFNPH